MRVLQAVTALLGTLGVASATHAESTETLNRRTGPVYKVKDLTGPRLTGEFQAGFTDLGIPALTPDGRLIFVCGDTFNDRVGGPNWRSPVGLYSSSTDLNNVNIDGCVGGNAAVGLVPESHEGGTTAIPSDVFAANGKLYMNLMRGVIYQTVSIQVKTYKPAYKAHSVLQHHSDFWVSNDSGNTWQYLFLWPGDMYNNAFQQKT